MVVSSATRSAGMCIRNSTSSIMSKLYTVLSWALMYLIGSCIFLSNVILASDCHYGFIYNPGLEICESCKVVCDNNADSTAACRREPNCQDYWPTTIPPSANSCPACVQPPPQISWLHMVLSVGLGTLLGFGLCLVMCYFGITKKMRVPARLKRILHDYKYYEDENDGSCDKVSVDSNEVNIGYEELADTKVHSSNEDSSGVAKDGEKLMQVNPVDECTGVYGGHNPQPMAFNAASDTSAVNKNNMDEQKGVETDVKTQILQST